MFYTINNKKISILYSKYVPVTLKNLSSLQISCIVQTNQMSLMWSKYCLIINGLEKSELSLLNSLKARIYDNMTTNLFFFCHFQTKEELQRVRRELVRSPKSPKTSLAAQAILRRVENERDDAMSDLRRMTTERDSLRERLKVSIQNL